MQPFSFFAEPDAVNHVEPAPLRVRDDCWLVGRRNPASLLQCNTYLRTFGGDREPFHVCIDPGSRTDYPHVRANLEHLIGDVGEIDCFTLNHQDPDVVGNAPAVCEANPNVGLLTAEETWRLAQHLDFRPRRVHLTAGLRSARLTLGDRHAWQAVPTPFCHFRGALAWYDPELRTLFSGDLFGGLNLVGRVQLLAEEPDWLGVAQFHQIYMPSREILRYAIRQIRLLDPPVEIIAPQHGHVLQGDMAPLFMEWLGELLVGHDLLAAELDDAFLHGYAEVFLELREAAERVLGPEEVRARLRGGAAALARFLRWSGPEPQLAHAGYTALPLIWAELVRPESLDVANTLRSVVLAGCFARQLPLPPIGAGLEEGPPPASISGDGVRLV